MPKDKSLSHERVLNAAKKEFLDNGFEKASIRAIAKNAGMTSAGLYRHCKDKEDLFCQIVDPAVRAVNEWSKEHVNRAYSRIDNGDIDTISTESEVDMIRTVAVPYRDEFRLLIDKSAGTRYEGFIHKFVKSNEEKMREGFEFLENHGFQIKALDENELHILISAYITALFEPIIHDCAVEDINHYLDTVEQFFIPGWKKILGL